MRFKSQGLFKAFVSAAVAFSIPSAFAADPTDTESVPRLRAGADYQLSLYEGLRSPGGRWDPYGYYTSYPSSASTLMWVNDLAGSARLTDHWEVAGSFSIRNMQLTVPSGSMHSTTLGSPALEARYTVNPSDPTRALFGDKQEDAFFSTLPLLTFRLGLTLPFSYGTRVVNGNPRADLQQTDDDGSGNYTGFGVAAGMSLSKRVPAIRTVFVFGVGLNIPFAVTSQNIDDTTGNTNDWILNGKQINLTEAASYMLSARWRLSGGFRQGWTGSTIEDAVVKQGSAGRTMSTSVGFAYQATPDWHFSASFDTQWPFYNYLVNQSYSPGLSLGLSYSGI